MDERGGWDETEPGVRTGESMWSKDSVLLYLSLCWHTVVPDPSCLSHLWLMRLPANHVEDLEGGRDGPVLVTVHLWETNTHDEVKQLRSAAVKGTVQEKLNIQVFIFSYGELTSTNDHR